MPRSTTRYISFELLQTRAPSSATVVTLMIACNDMSLANQTLGHWKEKYQIAKENGASYEQAWGACLYAIRAQIGHLYEGFKIIDRIASDAMLLRIIDQCDSKTQTSFDKLQTYGTGGLNQATLDRIAGTIRNNLGFHYDQSGKLVGRAIGVLAQRQRSASVTRASRGPDWYFDVASRVVDDVVCRQIWKIPPSADQLIEADKIIGDIHDVFLAFMDFSGEFIWRYCK